MGKYPQNQDAVILPYSPAGCKGAVILANLSPCGIINPKSVMGLEIWTASMWERKQDDDLDYGNYRDNNNNYYIHNGRGRA